MSGLQTEYQCILAKVPAELYAMMEAAVICQHRDLKRYVSQSEAIQR
jgi:hypothetical protein